jgi:MFS family permease
MAHILPDAHACVIIHEDVNDYANENVHANCPAVRHAPSTESQGALRMSAAVENATAAKPSKPARRYADAAPGPASAAKATAAVPNSARAAEPADTFANWTEAAETTVAARSSAAQASAGVASAAPSPAGPDNADPAAAETSTVPGAPKKPLVPLRRNWRFQLLWSGSACAFVGISAADVAYPLVILAMTHSPARAGAFATLQMFAMLFMTIPAGALLDKMDRRRLLLAAEGTRAVVASSVAVTWYLGTLTFWQLMGTALVLGAMQPLGTARMLMVRSVVPAEQLTSAVTQEQVRDQGSELVGPPLGGALFGLSRALPFVFCAVMFVVSFVCAFFVRIPAKEAPSPEPQQDQSQDQDSEQTAKPDNSVFSGIKTLLGNPLLRATSLTLMLVNMVGIPLNLCLIVLLQRQGVGSGTIGIALGIMSLGGLTGAALVKPLHRRLRPGWVLISACCVFTVCIFGVAFPHGPWYAAALMFTASLVIPAAVVMIDILILRQVPDEQRGRTMAALQTVMGLGMPLGMFSAGLALQYFSAKTTLIVIAAWLGAAVVYAASQRALRDAQWPENARPS